MQNDYNTHIIRLQNEVNRVFGKVVTSVADFEQLAEKVHLSPQSLRRFYGKIDKDKELSTSSLNLICAYIGVPDWESFCKEAVVQNLDYQSIINAFYDTNDYKTHIIRLQNEVNRVFGRVVTSVADFEQLAEQVHLSPQSLRRFYGKIDKDKKLSTSSLNLICDYIGVRDWESFCKGAVVQNLD